MAKWMKWYVAAVAMAATWAVGLQVGRAYQLDASGWAYWVQAIGSIAAIWAATSVARKQTAAAYENDVRIREADRERRSLAYQAVVQVVFVAGESLNRLIRYAPDLETLIVGLESFDGPRAKSALKAFEALPLHEVGSPGMIAAALEIRDSLVKILDSGNRLVKQWPDRTSPVATSNGNYEHARTSWEIYKQG